MLRRTLLAALALPALARAQAQAEPLSLAIPFDLLPDTAEAAHMISGGHLARQGFAPRLVVAEGSADAIRRLLAGEVALARCAAIDLFVAVARGNVPLVSVATVAQTGAFHLAAPRDRPLPEAAALRGRAVAVAAAGDSTDLLLDLLLRRAELPPDAVRRGAAGGVAGAARLLREGGADAAILPAGAVAALRRAGVPIESWPTDRAAPMPGGIYLTTRETIARNAELVVRVLRALRASAEELRGDPRAALARLLQDRPEGGEAEALASATQAFIRESWLSQGEANLLRNVPSLWQGADDAIRGARLAAVPDWTALWTNDLIERASR